MEKSTVFTIGMSIMVFLFLMFLILIAMILFRGETTQSFNWRRGVDK